MSESKYKRIGIISLKALFLIFLTVGLAVISRFIFVENMFEQEYFGEPVLNVWYMVFFFFIFNSLVIALNSHDKYVTEKFLAQEETGRFFSIVKFILSSPEFYIDIACITIVSFLLPTSFLYGFIAKTFFYNMELTEFKVKLYTLIIILPLLFVFDFISRIGVAKKWYQNSKSSHSNTVSEKKKKIPLTIKNIITVALVYCGASMVIPWLLPFLVTLWNIGDGMGFLWILLFMVIIVLIVIISYCIRAILKRKEFIEKLKKHCKTNSLYISDIKEPYRSIFIAQAGFDFSIEKNGKKYDCKFIAGVFPGSPIIFSDKGNGIKQNTVRLFRVELFHILTKFDYAYESEGKKILIVSPTPKNIYASIHEASPRPADVGEKIGEYTVYNSTGFLGALDRNCL